MPITHRRYHRCDVDTYLYIHIYGCIVIVAIEHGNASPPHSQNQFIHPSIHPPFIQPCCPCIILHVPKHTYTTHPIHRQRKREREPRHSQHNTHMTAASRQIVRNKCLYAFFSFSLLFRLLIRRIVAVIEYVVPYVDKQQGTNKIKILVLVDLESWYDHSSSSSYAHYSQAHISIYCRHETRRIDSINRILANIEEMKCHIANVTLFA